MSSTEQVVVVVDAASCGFGAVSDRIDFVVLALQGARERLADALVVLGEQKPMHGRDARRGVRVAHDGIA